MSRFLNATRRIDLGECRCPGAPHDSDWIELREATPWGAIIDATNADSSSEQFLIAAVGTIVRWNLEDEKGAVSVTEDTVRLLDVETFLKLTDSINAAMAIGNALPNSRGASSRRSRRVSAESPPQTIQAQ